MPPDQPTQETEQGYEIPVPLRAEVFADLEKVAKAETDEDGPSAV